MEKLTLLMREAFCWFSTSLKQTYTHRSSAHWDFTACSFLFSFCWSIIVRALPGRYAPQTPTGACAGRRAPELLGRRHRLLGKPEPVFALLTSITTAGFGGGASA